MYPHFICRWAILRHNLKGSSKGPMRLITFGHFDNVSWPRYFFIPGVAWLRWRVSGRWAGRCHAAPVASIRQMNRQVSGLSGASIRQMSRQVSRGSDGEYQADEQAGVAWLSWRDLQGCSIVHYSFDRVAHNTDRYYLHSLNGFLQG